MIDTKELRQVAVDCYWPTSPVPINEILDRLEAAEEDRFNFIAEMGRLCTQCDVLRTRIEAVEKQKPVGQFIQHPSNGLWEQDGYGDNPDARPLYALPGAQQCKNCNGMGDRFDPSGEKIPCDLCESNLEEIRVLVAEAAHDIISGSDFWLSTSLAAKKIYALPGAKGEEK